MTTLEDQLKDIRQRESEILEKIDERNKNLAIRCCACEKDHKIKDLRAIQTHGYIEPHGCAGGDYWIEEELQFICPETNIPNRLLFNNYDIPWKERRIYKNDPEQQFKRHYKKLFKKVIDSYDKDNSREFVNNFYVDENRRKFGLVEKRK